MQDGGKVKPDPDAIVWALWQTWAKLYDIQEMVTAVLNESRDNIKAIENAVLAYRDSHDETAFFSPWEMKKPNDNDSGFEPDGRDEPDLDPEEER